MVPEHLSVLALSELGTLVQTLPPAGASAQAVRTVPGGWAWSPGAADGGLAGLTQARAVVSVCPLQQGLRLRAWRVRSQRKACLPGSPKPAGETGREKAWLSHCPAAWETVRPECPPPARQRKATAPSFYLVSLMSRNLSSVTRTFTRAAPGLRPTAEECTREEQAPRPSTMQGRVQR